MDVSDRRLQVQLTQEAKIASDFSLFRAIFAFAVFVSALPPRSKWNAAAGCQKAQGERGRAEALSRLKSSPAIG